MLGDFSNFCVASYIGIVLVYRNSISDTVRVQRQVEQSLGTPMLKGSLPHVPSKDKVCPLLQKWLRVSLKGSLHLHIIPRAALTLVPVLSMDSFLQHASHALRQLEATHTTHRQQHRRVQHPLRHPLLTEVVCSSLQFYPSRSSPFAQAF